MLLEDIDRFEPIKNFYKQFNGICDLFSDSEKLEINRIIEKIGEYSGLGELIIKHAEKKILNHDSKLESLKKAIVYIGMPTVQNLVIYYLSKPLFTRGNSQKYKFDFDSYWKHCLGTSVAGKMIASKVCPEESHKIFTYGLIHDLGVVVINKCMPDKISDITELMRKSVEQVEAEKIVLEGISHQEIGWWICQKLNICEEITEVISNHHIEGNLRNKSLAAEIVCVANIISTEYYQRLLGIRQHAKFYELTSNFNFMSKKLALDISIALPREVEKLDY